ncbi:MAG: hypothetical protein N4J56_000063 [Chroococcidiopsis sp. SAG 2025]|uniref:hypothetical protein n=1 Tax=Chroococcidiopsis sp. SAG 2025 TaxID=171389 RepID=UPI00293713DA|nr:hypothetical protein [Chroococcidiopsis sp. SAG 2025]MDV2990409.1 hypothetical protein [Chroococcidiopsis sp. SAG 2025]
MSVTQSIAIDRNTYLLMFAIRYTADSNSLLTYIMTVFCHWLNIITSLFLSCDRHRSLTY